MRTVAWIALVGLLVQPAAAMVCETRCLTATASAVPIESNCHEPSPAAAGTLTLAAAHAGSCAHAEATDPASAPLPRASLAVLSTLDSQITRMVAGPRLATPRVLYPPRHRAPDDSSGTLRV
jgi:hypothetical protein